MKKKKSVSDKKLADLWSRAVKAKYKRCPVTGESDPEKLQPHHVVPKGRQNRFPLRWNIRNGVPLRSDIHRRYHDGDLDIVDKVHENIKQRGDWDYLQNLRTMLKHEYLQKLMMDEDEYRRYLKESLERIIEEDA